MLLNAEFFWGAQKKGHSDDLLFQAAIKGLTQAFDDLH
jgi:hypothetical protein